MVRAFGWLATVEPSLQTLDGYARKQLLTHGTGNELLHRIAGGLRSL
jgi:hypothetical protein